MKKLHTNTDAVSLIKSCHWEELDPSSHNIINQIRRYFSRVEKILVFQNPHLSHIEKSMAWKFGNIKSGLWHGSSLNFLPSVLKRGLLINGNSNTFRPSKPGCRHHRYGMLGPGIYLGPLKKAVVHSSGLLIECTAGLGKVWKPKGTVGRTTFANIKNEGYNTIVANAGTFAGSWNNNKLQFDELCCLDPRQVLLDRIVIWSAPVNRARPVNRASNPKPQESTRSQHPCTINGVPCFYASMRSRWSIQKMPTPKLSSNTIKHTLLLPSCLYHISPTQVFNTCSHYKPDRHRRLPG